MSPVNANGHNGNGSNGHDPHAASDEKVVIVSCDTHIGPRVKEDLREYCPKQYLEQFDDFVKVLEATGTAMGGVDALNSTAGHHDPHARLRDLDEDGTAAEVIFHGSQNGQPIPFIISDPSIGIATMGRKYEVDYEMAKVGRHIYNQWLADFCSVEPERHVGLCHLPMWDIDDAIKELEWARNAGLRAVNFPCESGPSETTRSRWGGRYYYNDPIWEPFWSACEDLGMQLATHGGAGDPIDLPGGGQTWMIEAQELGRRPMHRMIFAGVFERHPNLKLILTEHPGDWWRTRLADMDSTVGYSMSIETPKKPSDYAMANVFLGASFQARFEAEDAIEHGYWTNILWGTDYPHVEGTWIRPKEGETPQSQLSLRYAYHDMDVEKVKAMLGLNAVHVYGLDGETLHKVAQRINAPTVTDVVTPIDAIPEQHGMWAFRQQAAFA